jgi:uncharacterized membrane protein YoaK (UPF0700 family)
VPPSEDTARALGWRAAVLALIAGYVDSYAFVNYKVYTSFMSGNTTQAGLLAGQEKLAEAGLNVLPIPLFVVGIVAGAFLVHSSSRPPLSWLFGLVAALLTVDLAAVYFSLMPGWFSIMILSLAMGVMNTTITRVGGQSVSLGYVTGDLNNLGQHLALAIKRVPLAHAQGPWDSHWLRAALLAGVWTAFLVGALLAGAATARFAVWTLLPPIVALLALAALDRPLSVAA